MAAWLEQYEPLDVIGTGSFGVIRKVRRKTDGQVFARKELNFERMSDRDRKQIVAEVNILKDLHHEHIVRYHDRFVDREAGVLYILMEYCGGGDLSNIIHQAVKHTMPIPEDTIWSYFMQILLALQYCHHPNGHSRSASGNGNNFEPDGKEKRAQILHRDLKPDNVFLDASKTVKLGDFGLSKALAQASFANTYVGTPYYMSPELMQEKAYDSKSDIWSLGCIIYELCALKPPFHEAKTHAELSIFIRNGRIPPLPRGYSQALSNVIKAMLNLNPAMRPSAAQLLQHERLELVLKVSETEKMLATVKTHKSTLIAKERDLSARESALAEREASLANALSAKDAENAALKLSLSQHQERVRAREEELRVRVMKREEEVAEAMKRREGEIMEAVRRREVELAEAWMKREGEIRGEIEERYQCVVRREEQIREEEKRLEDVREELQLKLAAMSEQKGRNKAPLEEVKNLIAPLAKIITPSVPLSPHFQSLLETPINRRVSSDAAPSAMKGVVLTATGEPLSTPTPAELAKFLVDSPRVGLNFAKIFDTDSDVEEVRPSEAEDSETVSPPPSPSDRKSHSLSSSGSNAPPMRSQPPQLAHLSHKPGLKRTQSTTLPSSRSDSLPSSTASTSSSQMKAKRQSLSRAPPSAAVIKVLASLPPPGYDLMDEENLPSPFLKRTDRGREMAATTPQDEEIPSPFIKLIDRNRPPARHKPSNGNLLRTTAAVNSASSVSVRSKAAFSGTSRSGGGASSGVGRPSIASARKAGEEARKALLRA